MLYSASVVCDLLQSCYTGFLQFNPEEIVNYLTAASYLQMEHIVERCRGALEKYVQLKNPAPPKVGLPDQLLLNAVVFSFSDVIIYIYVFCEGSISQLIIFSIFPHGNALGVF